MTATDSRLRTAIVLAVVAMLGMAIVNSVRAQSPLEEAKALNARAMELYQAGKFSEAIPLVHRALAIREKALGPDHPRSAPSRCTGEAMMNTSDDAKRKLLEALETALLRSPFYDEKSRAEAMRFGRDWRPSI